MNITIVTPWLGHTELATDYMDAVLSELRVEDEVIVVDNGDAPRIPFATTVSPGENLGFARGSNYGLALVDTPATLFLNNDISYVRDGWLEQIRGAIEPGILAGPIRDPDHAVVDGWRFPYIDGWCLAGMTDDLRQLGGFDPRLEEPAYYSDNLLCLAARETGMRLRHVNVRLRHKLSQTAGPDGNPDSAPAAAANRSLYLAEARSVLVNL